MSINQILQESMKTINPSIDISMEGLMDMFAKFFKKKEKVFKDGKPGTVLDKKDKGYLDINDPDLKELISIIKGTYLNDAWLDRQTFVEGDIDASDFSETLSLDGKHTDDLIGNVKKHFERLDKLDTVWVPILEDYTAKIYKIDTDLKKEVYKIKDDSDLVEKAMDRAVDTLMRIGSPMKRFPKEGFNLISNRLLYADVKNNRFAIKETAPLTKLDKVKALNKDNIKVVGQLLLYLINYDYTFNKYDKVEGTDHSDGDDFNEITEFCNDEYYEITSLHTIYDYVNIFLYVDDGHEVKFAKALEKYINRSIK